MSRWPRTPSRYRSLATPRCPMGDNPPARPLRRTNQPTHLPARAQVRCHRQPPRPAGPTSRRHLHLRRSRSSRTSCDWPPRPTRLATERRTTPAPHIHAVVCDKMLPLRRRRLRPTPTRQANITIRQLTPAKQTHDVDTPPPWDRSVSVAGFGWRATYHGYRRDTLLSSSSITPHTTPPNRAPRRRVWWSTAGCGQGRRFGR